MADIVRLRYPAAAVEEIKARDPGTQVTVSMVRRLMATGELRYVCVGNGRRKMIDLGEQETLLSRSMMQQPSPSEPARAGGIRRIGQ